MNMTCHKMARALVDAEKTTKEIYAEMELAGFDRHSIARSISDARTAVLHRNGEGDSNVQDRFWAAARRASILHLVDLKRADHSPTRTEFRIPPDHGRRASVPVRPLNISALGSSAAMCVSS